VAQAKLARLQFIGSSDAFGAGGRYNTCFHVTGDNVNFLLDCGASSLPAMNLRGTDRNAIELMLITHFHADHFGGIPFFILDAMYISKRCDPLVIAGPPGLRDWYERAMAAAFPGDRPMPFELVLIEVEIGKRQKIGGLHVTPQHVRHDDRAGPCLAYRVEFEGKTLSYSGDTEWTDVLFPVAKGADLFICECSNYERCVPTHMTYTQLREHIPNFGAKRTILTHMSDEMLDNLDKVDCETARDGLVVEF
jgi:ribonuclease BN (tRNA processing enzyme)